jgi:Mn2+/Fe2+ NRAMP family transporter
VPWKTAALESIAPWSFLPEGTTLRSYAAMVVAVLGTTISPYLFFWQASQEVEESHRRPGRRELLKDPDYCAEHLSRIKLDTIVGMTFSNLVALCIVLATAVTLGQHGIKEIESAAQAAEALRPVAGELAFAVVRDGHRRHRPARGAGARRCRRRTR